MKKKLLGLMCAFSLTCTTLFSDIIPIYAQTVTDVNFSSSNDIIDETRKVSVNLEDDFSSNEVLVYFKHQYSELNKKWNIKDFDVDGIVDIKDLTYLDKSEKECKEYLDKVTFRQIVKLTLSKDDKQNVCDVIEKISSMEEVLLVTPNYYDNLVDDDANEAAVLSSDEQYIDDYAFDYMQVYDAWQYTTGSSSVKVGVMDTGIDNNSHISANLGTGYNFADNNYNTSDNDLPSPTNLSPCHGTRVASIIGGDTNGICQNVTIIPMKICSDVNGQTSRDIKINAINYANTHDIPILNMSYAGRDYANYQGMDVVISNYYGLFVNSAGNFHVNVDNASTPVYPAIFDCPNMIVVGSSDRNENQSFNSSWGTTSVDLAAPAHDITVLNIGGSFKVTDGGTSCAAPMVAATAALLLSYNSNLTTSQLKYAILNSVDNPSGLNNLFVTNGRLNIYKALKYVEPRNKYRNYVIRNEVNGAYYSSNSAYLSLGFMQELYDVVNTTVGDAVPSNTVIHSYGIFSGWNASGVITLDSVNATQRGSVANFIIRSSFIGDRNFIENDITYSSNHSAIHANYILLGDVNLDGKIDTADRDMLSRAVAHDITLTGNSKLSADVDLSNTINSSDLARLQSYINNTINKFY